jgi:hypothetical protein
MLGAMNRQRVQTEEPRIGGFTHRAFWRLVRWIVRWLIVMQAAAGALPAGRLRAGLIRELTGALGIAERAVRCLLLEMRVPVRACPVAFGHLPGIVRGVSGHEAAAPEADADLPDLPNLPDLPDLPDMAGLVRAPRFSLYLKELARRPGARLVPAGPSGQRRRPRRGAEARFDLRLAALRHALTQTEAQAARMAAFMIARGYRRRLPRPVRPSSGFGLARFWALLAAHPVAAVRADTS